MSLQKMKIPRVLQRIFTSAIAIAFSFYTSLLFLLHNYSTGDTKSIVIFGSTLIVIIIVVATTLSINWFKNIFTLTTLITTLFLSLLYKTEIGKTIKHSIVKLITANLSIKDQQKDKLVLLNERIKRTNIPITK
jgi:hypothetical protein